MPIIDSVECGSENTLSNEEIQELAGQIEFTVAYCMRKRESQNAREDIALLDRPRGGEPDGFYPLVRIGHNRGRVFVNREKLDQWINEQDGSRKDLS